MLHRNTAHTYMKQKGKSSEQENLFELHDRTSNWICKFEMQIDLFGRKTTVWNFYVQAKLLTISIDVAEEKNRGLITNCATLLTTPI